MCAYYSYVSTKAGCDPVKTIFLLVPDTWASSAQGAEEFARREGWVAAAEADAAVLVCPVVPKGWADADHDLVRSLYLAHRNDFHAPSGTTIPGREGSVWTWEPLIHVVGYEEGAVHAGNLVVAHPGFAATFTLVDGAPSDYAPADEPSDHWFVPEPSRKPRACRDVPMAVWLVGSAARDERALAYFGHACHEGLLLITKCLRAGNPALAELAVTGLMSHVVRWKNAPDGTLALRGSRRDFYEGNRFEHREVVSDGIRYPYAVHLPVGLSHDDARGLALVLSIHGRGEPAWIFADKNGWEDLADETREFAVLLPDSPGNIWDADRDAGALEAVVRDALAAYGLEATRVYVTGFSNGAAYTWQQATTRPWLFAAASPSNCPPAAAIAGSGMGDYVWSSRIVELGYELPFWVYAGDSDAKAPLDPACVELACAANGCSFDGGEALDAAVAYRRRDGYCEGERFATAVYRNVSGSVRVGVTMMRDMPHGAIADEARAAWRFMRRFRRVDGSKHVEEEEG